MEVPSLGIEGCGGLFCSGAVLGLVVEAEAGTWEPGLGGET
jgi:hypothetical protein